MTLVCPQCQIRVRLLESDVPMELMTDRGSYQLFSSDFYECPSCRKQVHILAEYPICEHFKPEYKEMVAQRTTKRFWMSLKEKEQYDRSK